MKKLLLIATLFATCSSAIAMDENGWASTYESLSAFDSKANPLHPNGRPGYVKPIIDNLGNVLNSNWYVSASVPQSFTFEAGLPFALIGTGDGKTFSEKNAYGIKQEVPTIFGDKCDVKTLGSTCYNSGVVYGNETLNGLSVFTYPYLQLGASIFHARVVLRGMYLPAISELRKFSEFGFGLQYSFGHLFQYMLPPAAQPFDVSLVFGYNTSGIGYRPEDFDGQLNLDVSTINFSVVLGYKVLSFIEVMMSLGYQSAEMESSGHLEQLKNGDIPYPEGMRPTINPDITVKGNNGFRFGLSVAFQLGKSFHPVVGYDYAGKSSFTTNLLYFRQQFGEDKTPDEIAKDKGYVRGAKSEDKAPATTTTEEAPQEPEDSTESGEDNYSNDSQEDNVDNQEAETY